MMEDPVKMAAEKDAEQILRLYRSVMGKDGCTWDLEYPGPEDIQRDIENRSLYVVFHEGRLIAAAAAGEDEELSDLDCYSKEMKHPCELARIAVDQSCQNRGIAKGLLGHIEQDVLRRGFDGIRFLVSKTNPHARAVYDAMGYRCCGECVRYDKDWYCYEKLLSLPQK